MSVGGSFWLFILGPPFPEWRVGRTSFLLIVMKYFLLVALPALVKALASRVLEYCALEYRVGLRIWTESRAKTLPPVLCGRAI